MSHPCFQDTSVRIVIVTRSAMDVIGNKEFQGQNSGQENNMHMNIIKAFKIQY